MPQRRRGCPSSSLTALMLILPAHRQAEAPLPRREGGESCRSMLGWRLSALLLLPPPQMKSSWALEATPQPPAGRCLSQEPGPDCWLQTPESNGGLEGILKRTSFRSGVALGKQEFKEGGDITSRNSPQVKDSAPCKILPGWKVLDDSLRKLPSIAPRELNHQRH